MREFQSDFEFEQGALVSVRVTEEGQHRAKGTSEAQTAVFIYLQPRTLTSQIHSHPYTSLIQSEQVVVWALCDPSVKATDCGQKVVGLPRDRSHCPLGAGMAGQCCECYLHAPC